LQPADINLAGCIYHIGTRIGLATLIEEHTPITALLAANKEDGIVPQGKAANVGHAVCHLSANGVVVGEGCLGADVLLNVINYLSEFVEGLGRLGVETNVAIKVELPGIICRLDDDGRFLRLSHKAKHLSMTVLTKDDNLFFVLSISIILLLDAFLKVQHHGASGVNQVDGMLAGKCVGRWRFAMGTEQDLGIVDVAHLVVIDGDEPHLLQAVALLAIVHDVAQAIEPFLLRKFLLSLADGTRHTETKARTLVDFYFHAAKIRNKNEKRKGKREKYEKDNGKCSTNKLSTL